VDQLGRFSAASPARIQRGPAVLTLVTSFKDPYADSLDQGLSKGSGRFLD
jgi:hypothetical protein